ncbi:MAG: TauD/TfdA family dioxygenase [Gammaproteobacteria bacterium]|nr:TauD/TfdA family dioxygenase [Gammaproteobacteria bacterium]
MIEVRPLNEHIGAEVRGVDLREPLDPATREQLNSALLEHLVLVLPAQELTAEQYRDALAQFGKPMRQHRERYNLPDCPDVSIVTNQGGFGRAEMWHTDHTNHERPPKLTVLHARALPDRGGDTWFANMYKGLEALSSSQQDQLRSLWTINDMEDNPGYSAADRQRYKGGARHPMIRTHDETGRPSLYFHVTKSQRIEGMADTEVRPFLEGLLDQAVQPDWVYKHRWRVGDVVICDNRCAMHRVDANYPDDQLRLLWRVIIEGERPH